MVGVTRLHHAALPLIIFLSRHWSGCFQFHGRLNPIVSIFRQSFTKPQRRTLPSRSSQMVTAPDEIFPMFWKKRRKHTIKIKQNIIMNMSMAGNLDLACQRASKRRSLNTAVKHHGSRRGPSTRLTAHSLLVKSCALLCESGCRELAYFPGEDTTRAARNIRVKTNK